MSTKVHTDSWSGTGSHAFDFGAVSAITGIITVSLYVDDLDIGDSIEMRLYQHGPAGLYQRSVQVIEGTGAANGQNTPPIIVAGGYQGCYVAIDSGAAAVAVTVDVLKEAGAVTVVEAEGDGVTLPPSDSFGFSATEVAGVYLTAVFMDGGTPEAGEVITLHDTIKVNPGDLTYRFANHAVIDDASDFDGGGNVAVYGMATSTSFAYQPSLNRANGTGDRLIYPHIWRMGA